MGGRDGLEPIRLPVQVRGRYEDGEVRRLRRGKATRPGMNANAPLARAQASLRGGVRAGRYRDGAPTGGKVETREHQEGYIS